MSIIKGLKSSISDKNIVISSEKVDEVAIVGINVELNNIQNEDEYWDALINGVEVYGSLSDQRKKIVKDYQEQIDVEQIAGNYLSEIDRFDPTYFNITPREAEYMNPVQRRILHSVRGLFDNSGYKKEDIYGEQVGVYLGLIADVGMSKYRDIIKKKGNKDMLQFAAMGNLGSATAGRISYFWNFSGPCIAVETACSSSLVALQMACDAIRNGECSSAVVASANMDIMPGVDEVSLGFESGTNHTKPFSENADGTSFGEGIISVYLKPLSKALKDNDTVYAVIKGGAINQDGYSLGLTVPNPSAQAEVIQRAWDNSKIDPLELSYIEAHGTATKIGDPIEIDGINTAFHQYADLCKVCAIGSVKANVGHLYAAAGLAAVVKCALIIKNRKIPPLINYEIGNKQIDFDNSYVFVSEDIIECNKQPILCGISSFGLSGTNCHVVLGEYTAEREYERSTLPFAISATDIDSLRNQAKEFLNFINSKQNIQYGDLCYTSCVGRPHQNVRGIALVKSLKQIKEYLESLLMNQEQNLDFSDVDDYVKNYLGGDEVDWENIFQGKNVKRVYIPSPKYDSIPFWIGNMDQAKSTKTSLYEIQWVKDKKIKAGHRAHVKSMLIPFGTLLDSDITWFETVGSLVYDVDFGRLVHDWVDEICKKVEEERINEIVLYYNEKELKSDTFEMLNESKCRTLDVLFLLSKALHFKKDLINIHIVYRALSDTDIDKQWNPYMEMLKGFVKSINKEFGSVFLKLTYLDRFSQLDCIDITNEQKDSSEIGFYCHDTRYVEMLSQKDITEYKSSDISFDFEDAYIITGGLGAIGLKIGLALAEKTVCHLILTGRRKLEHFPQYRKEEVEKILKKIEKLGSTVTIINGDIADAESVHVITNLISEENLKLNGIFHCAGNAGRGLLLEKDMANMHQVTNPKIEGTWNLLHVKQICNANFMVCFSSEATLMTLPGQSDYVAGNSFMNANSNLLEGVMTICWPAWSDIGMAKDNGVTMETLFKQITTEDGIKYLFELLKKQFEVVYIGTMTNNPFAIQLANIKMDESIKIDMIESRSDESSEFQVTILGREGNDYTENELKLASVWGEVLGLHSINIYDSFYSLGGDSILAVQIVKAFSERYGIMVALGDMMSTPTVFEIAKKLDEQMDIDQEHEKVQSEVAPKREFALSETQQRIYIASLMGGETDVAYNLPKLFRLEKLLDIDKLEDALEKLIHRHEILRTSFHEKNGELYQLIHDSCDIAIQESNVSGDIYEEVQKRIRPFKLSEVPLFRLELIHGNQNEYLFIDMHHIIVDGFSAVIMLRELLDLYFDKELPKLSVQYKDYVKWYQNNKTTGYFAEAEEYWEQKLKGDVTPTSLCHQAYDLREISNAGKRISVNLSEEIQNIVKSYAQKHNGTSNMVYLMVLYIVLYRFTNSKTLMVGMPTTGRMNPSFNYNIGSFINLAPLSIEIADDYSMTEMFEAVKSNIVHAISYQEYAYEEILKKTSNVSRNQMFHIMYSYLNIEKSKYSIHDVSVEQEDIYNGCAKYEISLEVVSNGEETVLRWDYMTDLFSDKQIKSISDVFIHILKNLDKVEVVNEMEVCGEEQLYTYEKIYNDTARTIDHEKTIADLFEKEVENRPNIDAVICGSKKVSYVELNERSNQCARLFRKNTNKENPTILLLLGRTEKLIMALLGCLKLGATYIPVDPDYPRERIDYIVKDSDVDLLVTDKNFGEEFNLDCPILELNYQWEELSKDNLHVNICPDQDVYRIYTSGSTGKPKGVRIPYKALTNFVLAMTHELPMNDFNVVLNLTTVSFDIFAVETFLPLISGKTIVLAQESEQLDMTVLAELVINNKIDFLQMTPSRANMFLNYCKNNTILSDVKVVLLGGEVVPNSLVDRIKINSQARIYNVYGPTETTVWSSISELTNKCQVDAGHFISNTQGYILNSKNKLQPIGGIGELCISGEGLSNGYVNQSENNIDNFIPNPYRPGQLMYKTGDLAYFEEGCIHILGRIDSQVKVRGYRVELEEVENSINKLDHIMEAAVKVQKDEQNEILVCFYVSKSEMPHDWFRSELGRTLPDYMVPSYFERIEKIPYTPNGKIDRNKLPEFKNKNVEQKNKAILFENTVEKKIYDIWEECLGHDKFSLHDNYFDIGGTSLSLIKMQALINELYPNSLTVTDLFQYSTIKNISAKLLAESGLDSFDEEDSDQVKAYTGDIAVVGMGANLPQSNSIQEFWEKLCDGTDFIGELDETRKNEVLNYISYVRTEENREIESTEIMQGAYLEDIDKFDCQLFKLSPKEASLMDPNQRLLLQVVNSAIEDAGYNRSVLKGTKTGVYIGNSDDFGINYKRLLEVSSDYHSGSILPGNIKSVLAGRISYLYDLKGPSIVVDTACSSSLVAIDIACQDIRNGKCSQAIVGASNLILVPLKNEQRIGIESSDGRTKTFDNASDGTGVGEGVIAFMLKPMDLAKKDHDNIYAVIKGSAINQDGSSIGLTAPNADSQTKVILQACRNANVPIDTIQYFEAHGTGTNIGDPIEVQGITNAFKKYNNQHQICAIGSVKTNLGHLDNCAGMVGFLKTVLALKNKKIPPILHFSEPNEKIDFIQSPVYVNDILREWKVEDTPRRAAINAFGLSGTNCCVILEEPPVVPRLEGVSSEALFTLSAPNEELLLELVKQYIDVINTHPEYSLEDICYTVNTKREVQKCRLAHVVKSKEELILYLQSYCRENHRK